MNWTRCSEVVLGLLLVVGLTAVGAVGAVSFDDSEVPTESKVGTDAGFTVTMADPFENQPDRWTVTATTELENATVTIQSEDGSVSATGNGSATLQLDGTEIVGEDVVVEVAGEVPAVQNYSYENLAEENITGLEVSRAGGATLETWQVHRFTEGSKQARQAIDNASAAVENASDSDAEDRLEEAITFYNDENFGQATDAAEDAESSVSGSDNSSQVILIAGIAAVLVVLVGGGIYAWQSRQQDTSKLQ